MSASGTISNLQQALNCAGKCDCCSNLQQQINQINSRLAQLKPIDEQAIINKSVDASKAIVPGIAQSVVATSLIPIFDDITWLKNAVSTALTLAKEALFLVGKLVKEVAMIAATIAAAIAAAASLQALFGRIDAVEAGLDQANNFISQLFSQVKAVKNTAEGADKKAEKAIKGVDENTKSIVRLSVDVSETKSLARTALSRAVEADRKADVAQAFAERAAEIANIGIRKADTAQAFAERAAEIANIANKKADTANNRLDNVEPLLDLVNQLTMDHTGQIISLNNDQLNLKLELDQVSGKISNLEFLIPGIDAKANQAIQKSTQAESTANTANNKATSAQQEAQAAIAENARLRSKINALEQKDVYLERGITQAQQEAYAALQLGGLGLVTAQNTAQGLSNVAGRVGIIGGTAINADTKATNALGEISTIKNGVVTSPAIQNAIAQPIGKINDSQQKQAEQIKQIEQKIANPGGVNTREVTRTEFEQIKQKLGEADNMNREGVAKLDEILSKLPALPAAVASATAARVPSLPQIRSTVGSAMCESAQSGGCLGGALNNQASGIKQDFGQKLRDLEQGLNAGANAAQMVLLTRIDTKLGAQIVGGIGGSLGKFYEWAQVDRILNILTFAATVHNAAMLSNDIAQTLLGAINNVLTLILPKDKDNNPINVGGIIGSTIENAIKGVIGAENYTALNETWSKANRIYQATTNVLNNFLNLTQTILQASELIASYTGKIGNALKKGGVIIENAYGWMNPQPKFNRVTQTLEALQNGASTIQMVTQVPLDIINATTELTTASTEFIKAVKEDDKPENKATEAPEPDDLKAKEGQSKTDSQPFTFDFSDLFDGEDL